MKGNTVRAISILIAFNLIGLLFIVFVVNGSILLRLEKIEQINSVQSGMLLELKEETAAAK